MAHGVVRRESVETEMHKSEDKSKTFVYTKKRGYDVTRNPNLNKVTRSSPVCEFTLFSKYYKVDELFGAFRCCRVYWNSK